VTKNGRRYFLQLASPSLVTGCLGNSYTYTYTYTYTHTPTPTPAPVAICPPLLPHPLSLAALATSSPRPPPSRPPHLVPLPLAPPPPPHPPPSRPPPSPPPHLAAIIALARRRAGWCLALGVLGHQRRFPHAACFLAVGIRLLPHLLGFGVRDSGFRVDSDARQV